MLIKPMIYTVVCLLLSPLLALSEMALENKDGVKIRLQPHQQYIVDYLSHPKNKDQEGLILYHGLGSGKTYASIGASEKQPHKKVILLIPKFLESNWIKHINTYGVKNKSRYHVFTFENSNTPESIKILENFLKENLSDAFVIVDEVHKIIAQLRNPHNAYNSLMSKTYTKLQTAHKILLLTGTPIFVDTTDISYLANLVLKKDTYPLDSTNFKLNYMDLNPVKSLIRGHFLESNMSLLAAGPVLGLTATFLLSPIITSIYLSLGLIAGGFTVIPIIQAQSPVKNISFRSFNVEKWSSFTERYVSFYKPSTEKDDNYPHLVLKEKTVKYSSGQINFLFDFMDYALPSSDIELLTKDSPSKFNSHQIKLNPQSIQASLLNTDPLICTQIGNFTTLNVINNQQEDPPKFKEILDIMIEKPGQIAVYSRYFENGIMLFKKFLESHNLGEQIVVLKINDSPEEINKKLELYNTQKKRIILIHPEITEGINLLATEQFHILEPIPTRPLEEQIIGRSVRYKSHEKLPENRRKVTVYFWECTLSLEILNLGVINIPTKDGLLRLAQWQKKFSEVSVNFFTQNISDIDPAFFKKDTSPDTLVLKHRASLERDLNAFHNLLDKHSIEKIN